MKVESIQQIMLGNRKFVRNHYVPEKDAFLTCFMNDELTKMHGYCIVKQTDLKVYLCCFLESQLHGFCLTYKLGKLISLDHFVEGKSIDQPFAYRKNVILPDDVDQNGIQRTELKFNGFFYFGKRIDNSHGFLSYVQNKNKCQEQGLFCS